MYTRLNGNAYGFHAVVRTKFLRDLSWTTKPNLWEYTSRYLRKCFEIFSLCVWSYKISNCHLKWGYARQEMRDVGIYPVVRRRPDPFDLDHSSITSAPWSQIFASTTWNGNVVFVRDHGITGYARIYGDASCSFVTFTVRRCK